MASVVPALNGSASVAAYGFFLNMKLGYKYVYILPALAVYYQNYGTFTLLGGGSESFSGYTFAPSIGLCGRIPLDVFTKKR